MIFYVDGEWVPEEQAVMPVLDFGFMYGDGCFESIAVAEGKVLDLDRRIERLLRSAKMLRLDPALSESELRGLMLETASRNGMADVANGWIRPMLSRGVNPLGLGNASRSGVLRILAKAVAREPSIYRGPIAVTTAILSTYARATPAILDPRIKASSYTPSTLAIFEANDRGADHAIMRDANGFITEAATANVFCVSEGRLFTPALAGVLGGLTRRRMIDAARTIGVECVETNLTRYDFETADEAFVTAAMTCVAAIGSFEGSPIAEAPGPVTTALRDAYVESAFADATPVPSTAGV